jgi:CMD domain protein
MSETEPDVIDVLAGVEKGSRLDEVRAQRQEARENAQKSFQTLFAPKHPGGVTVAERYAVATFVAGLHRDAAALAFYRSGLAAKSGRDALIKAIEAEIARGVGQGPYGAYPRGPLSAEDKAGPTHRIAEANRAALGPRLAAAFEHAHLLVFHPRDSGPAALQSLLDAGWSTNEIVTLSQLVSFLAFQIRAAVGLRALQAASTEKD